MLIKPAEDRTKDIAELQRQQTEVRRERLLHGLPEGRPAMSAKIKGLFLRRLVAAVRPLSDAIRHQLTSLEDRLDARLVQRAHQRGEDAAWMGRHDGLTGLPNRMAFTENVRALRRRNVSGAIAVLDLDHFKRINDQHGHQVGDDIIVALATRLQSTVTADILTARYGGEEFALFIPGDMARARPLMDRLLAVIRQPIQLPSCTVCVTASIGLAPLPAGLGLDQGLSSADTAMYAAKASGRDRVHEFCAETHGVVTARREWAQTVATLQAENRELQELVQLDALTGLRSRRSLDQLLERTCGGAGADAQHCGVAFLDIDHFGSYNKHHGDDQGDHALRRVAQIIQNTARKGDLVYRKGGEEIVVVLSGATKDEAELAAERMRSAVEDAAIQHAASPTAPVVTITLGVASSQGRELGTIHQLMNLAAQAAMRAKVQAQRNQVHVA